MINSYFTNNTANRDDGAINMDSGTVSNCNFTNNSADKGGAVFFNNEGYVTNCSLTGNNATAGSAIYFDGGYFYAKSVSNSLLLNNRADSQDLEVTKNKDNITISFKGKDNLLNAIFSFSDVSFSNVTYWGAKGIVNTDSSNSSRSINESGQNIRLCVLVNDTIVLNGIKVTDEKGMIVLNITAGEKFFIGVRHDADSYYTEAEKIISNNTKFKVNVTSQKTNNMTVNITAESNILQ